MQNTQVAHQFLGAKDLPNLRIAFSKLCGSVGEVERVDIVLNGTYGDFAAFCTAEMKTTEAEETLIGKYGFQQLGTRIYLPRVLPLDFERRALARVA